MEPRKNLENATHDEVVDDIEKNMARARRGLEEDPGFIDEEPETDAETYDDSGEVRPDLDDQTIAPG